MVRPARTRGTPGKPPVILWADTFNNHFTPAVAKAAVEVLEHAGYGFGSAAEPLLRPAALRLRHARYGEGPASRNTARRCASRSVTAFPSSAWSRAA